MLSASRLLLSPTGMRGMGGLEGCSFETFACSAVANGKCGGVNGTIELLEEDVRPEYMYDEAFVSAPCLVPPVKYDVRKSQQAASPLATAVCRGSLTDVEKALLDDPDVNLKDAWGHTPVFQAAALGNAQVIARLLLAKADPSLRSPAGSSAVDIVRDKRLRALMSALAPPESGLVADLGLFDEAVAMLPEPLQEEIFQALEKEPRQMHI